MKDSEKTFTDPRLPFLPPTSRAEGVFSQRADFESRGESAAPFQGARFRLEPGSTSALDVHPDRECWMVVSGQGLLSYDGQQIRVSGGDYLYFEPNKSHQIHNDRDEDLMIYTLWWD